MTQRAELATVMDRLAIDEVITGYTEPTFMSGGRYAFSLLRTQDGWRLSSVVVREKWRRTTG